MTTASTKMTDTPKRDAHASFQDVKEDVHQIADDVKDCAADAASAGLAVVRSSADRTMATGRRMADAVGGAHQKVEDYVVAHPTTSLLLAVGVGAVISRLIPRR